MKLLYLCLVGVFCMACSQNAAVSHRNLVEAFPVESRLPVEPIEVEPVLFFLGDMLMVDNYLVTVDMKNDVFFQFFQLPDLNYIGSSKRRGQGPDEEIAVLPLLHKVDATSFAYRTLDKLKIVTFNAETGALDTNKEFLIPEKFSSVLNTAVFEKALVGYDVNGMSDTEFKKMSLPNLTVEDFGPNFPEVSFQVETEMKNRVFSKVLASHPAGNLLVSIYDKLPLLRIYNAEGEVIAESEFQNHQVAPVAYGKDKLEGVDISATTINYLKVKVTDKFIYGLYAGKTHQELNTDLGISDYGNEIHLWDWQGNPVARIFLDRGYSNFAVANDGSYLLLYTYGTDHLLYKMNLDI